MRSGLRIAALAAAAFAGATGGRSDAGRFVDAVTMEPGDTVLGDLLSDGAIDELRTVLPRGTQTSWTVTRSAPGRLTPVLGGLLDDAFDDVPLVGVSPVTVRSDPVPRSGLHRFVLSNARGTLGAYRVRLTVKPAKAFTASGTSDTAPAPVLVGAYAGATLDVTLRWTGPAPVTIAAFTGPGGASLQGAGAAVVRGGSSVQRGFIATATGEQTLSLGVPAGTTRWSARIAVRSPKPAPQVRDTRTAGFPEEAPFEILDAGFAWCRLFDEEGGPNAWILGSQGAAPAAGPLDDRRGACVQDPLDGPTATATMYDLECTAGFSVAIRGVVRNPEGRIESFEAVSVRDPGGTGSASYEAFQYDGTGRPVAWRETRRFAATGRIHRFEISEVVRFPNGSTSTCVVVHTDPAGRTRTYLYGPYR